MGFVDRGGGREAKGSSLRRSKKNPGAASTRNKSQNKSYVSPTTRAQARPPPVLLPILDDLRKQQQQQQTTGEAGVLCYDPLRWKQETDGPSSPSSQGHRYVDAAVALLSRKLEEDHAGVIRRASSEGQLQSLLCWCNEVERQQLMVDTCIDHNKLATQRRLKTKDVRSTSVAATKPAEKVKKHVKFSEDGDQSDAESSSVAKTAAPQPVSVVESITHSSSAINDAPEDCLLYCLAGIHVNNIDRTNKKAHEQWIHEVEELAKHDVVLGILSGLNLSRESGTHFAQELLLRQCWGVAARQQLPLVLHLYATEEDTAGASFPMLARTAERAVEVLNELLEESEDEHGEALPSPPSIVLHQALNVLCCSPALTDFVREHRPGVEGVVPVYAIITADLIATLPNASSVLPIPVVSSTKEAVMAMMEQRVLHLSQLLIGTASPWGTPQSIPDEYVRQLPNEPANYPFVVEEIRSTSSAGVVLDETEGLGAKDLMDVVLHNFCRVFFAEYVRDPYGSLLAEGDGEAAASTQANANEGGSSTVEDVAVHAQLTAIRAGLKTKKVGAHAGAGSTYACVECGALLLRADAEVTHAEEPRAPAAAAKSRASEKKAQRGSKKKKKKGDVSSDEDDGEDEGGAATAVSSCDGPLKYWQVDAAAHVDPHQCDGEGGLHQPQVRGLRQSQAVVVAATNNVTCASCSSKVGRLREHPSCECGLMIPGLCLCLLENRVELVATQKTSTKKAAAHVPAKHAAESVPTDIPTTTAALRPPAQETAHASQPAGPAEAEDELQKLLREAALERERMESSKEAEEERAAAAAEELRQLKRSKKEKKKNVKANNRSNFTHFRNKDFAPTRGGKSEGDEAMMSDSASDSDG